MAKILLVDDDIELTALLKDILSLEGYDVIEANNGIEGIAKIESITEELDIILLDIMMPKMNGMDMLRKLRETNETPVLMLTAKGEEIDRVIGLELGADDYLPKPFSDRELLARIRAILRRTQTNKTKDTPSNNIRYQDIEIFIGKQEAYSHGQLLDLTGTEFGLLVQFIQKHGEIISKDELSLEVLGKRLAPFDRAIDMHVSNLRKKLPLLAEGKPRIKTLRGRGYLFAEE